MPEKSAQLLKQLGEKSTSDRTVVRTLVKSYLETNQYDEMVTLLEGLIKGASDSEELHYIAGVAYDGKGDEQLAIAHLEKVGKESPFFTSAAVQIALIYQKVEKIDTAITYLTALIKEMPEKSDFYLYLGSFYEQKDEIENHIQKVIRELDLEKYEKQLLNL